VRALEDTELAALSGPDFVSAVTGFSATSSTAEQLVSATSPKTCSGTRSDGEPTPTAPHILSRAGSGLLCTPASAFARLRVTDDH
jgi:hypothetical protein